MYAKCFFFFFYLSLGGRFHAGGKCMAHILTEVHSQALPLWILVHTVRRTAPQILGDRNKFPPTGPEGWPGQRRARRRSGTLLLAVMYLERRNTMSEWMRGGCHPLFYYSHCVFLCLYLVCICHKSNSSKEQVTFKNAITLKCVIKKTNPLFNWHIKVNTYIFLQIFSLKINICRLAHRHILLTWPLFYISQPHWVSSDTAVQPNNNINNSNHDLWW